MTWSSLSRFFTEDNSSKKFDGNCPRKNETNTELVHNKNM